MAFVYEYFKEEDIERLGLDKALDELSIKYNDIWKVEFTGRPIPWLIDRDRNILFTFVGKIRDNSDGKWDHNYKHFTREKLALLYYKGIAYEIRLLKENEQSRYTETPPYKRVMYGVVWKLLSIAPLPSDLVLFKKLVLEALEVYGNNGRNLTNDEYLKELTVVLKD